MLQALPAERFQLKFHRETAERRGLAMTVGKGGPKFYESASEETSIHFGGAGKPAPGGPISLTVRKFSMPMLARLLSQVNPVPIADKTGLTGAYDFTLAWDEGAGPSLATAVQEQLGPRMEAQKVPVSTFVIDSAEKPSGN